MWRPRYSSLRSQRTIKWAIHGEAQVRGAAEGRRNAPAGRDRHARGPQQGGLRLRGDNVYLLGRRADAGTAHKFVADVVENNRYRVFGTSCSTTRTSAHISNEMEQYHGAVKAVFSSAQMSYYEDLPCYSEAEFGSLCDEIEHPGRFQMFLESVKEMWMRKSSEGDFGRQLRPPPAGRVADMLFMTLGWSTDVSEDAHLAVALTSGFTRCHIIAIHVVEHIWELRDGKRDNSAIRVSRWAMPSCDERKTSSRVFSQQTLLKLDQDNS